MDGEEEDDGNADALLDDTEGIGENAPDVQQVVANRGKPR
jgi:hypothetical protein